MKTSLKYLSKKEWYLEHFDGCPAFTEMTGSGFTSELYKSKIPVYTINICFYSDGEGDWMTFPSDQKHIGKYIIKQFMRKDKSLEETYKEWLKNFDLLMKFYYNSFEKDLSNMSNNEIWNFANNVYIFYRKKVSMPGFIDGYMFYAAERFDELVKEFCEKNNIMNHPQIYSMLSAPIEPSFIKEEESDLIKIADKNDLSLIKKHIQKYSWVKSSYSGYKEYTFKDVKSEISKIRKEGKHKKTNVFLEHKKTKYKLIKKYRFTEEILSISKISEMLVKWQDQRKIYTLTFASLQEKILSEVSAKTRIDLNLLRYCSIKDIKRALENKLSIDELKERKKSSLFIYRHGRIIDIIAGKDAKEYLERVSKVDIKNAKEFKGMTASIGFAKGPVRIITSAKNIHKVKKGDILVAPMTRPEHLIGMKKAAAIITDDGGITCHAAIVARELRIPCIIGTKIATKLLKDGDIVEVDADKGTVRIK